jgi:hypothetical protein
MEHNMWTFFQNNDCLKHFSEELSEIRPKMYIGIHVNYPLLLSDFNETWVFSSDFRKTLKYQTSRKSVQCGPSSSIREGRRTDRRNVIVATVRTRLKIDKWSLHATWVCVCVRPISTSEPLHRLQPKWYKRYATQGRPKDASCNFLTLNVPN